MVHFYCQRHFQRSTSTLIAGSDADSKNIPAKPAKRRREVETDDSFPTVDETPTGKQICTTNVGNTVNHDLDGEELSKLLLIQLLQQSLAR